MLTDPAVNSQYTYVLGVNDFDFGNSGADLEKSMAFITVINNVQSFEFPKLSVDTFNMTHHYYFFGCITVDSSKYSRISAIVEIKTFSQAESSPPARLPPGSFSTETTTVSGWSSEIIIAELLITSVGEK